jgi:pimeloyl-ACP methyl ester carboxylesterase
MPIVDEQIRLEDGRRLGCAEYGDPTGRPVFLFQGTPSSRLLHPDEAITAELGVRLIMLDRPGFGRSDFQPRRTLLDWPADVAEVADGKGLDRFAVIGISGGGPYVAACAHEIPQRLTAAAMVSSGGPFDAPGAMEGMPRIRRAGARIAHVAPWLLRPLLWLVQNPGRDVDAFFDGYTAHNPEPDRRLLEQPYYRDMFKASYGEACRSGVRGFAWEVRIVAWPWGFRLEDIAIPVHIWHGDLDNSTPLAMAQCMAQAIPDAQLTVLPGEGHLFLLSRWREILASLAAR